MEHLFVFGAGFLQMGLKGLQIFNAVRHHLLKAFITSLGITYTWAYGIVLMVSDPQQFVHALAFGCAVGYTFSIWADGKFNKEVGRESKID